MKPTLEILERIERSSKDHKDGTFTRLYRYLLREDIYYIAYQNLYANKGATTKGVDNDTADGFSKKYVEQLIHEIETGGYKPKPVRRISIPKKNGKTRPLGIPSFKDKLLQEVIRMILEAIYEPIFCKESHGFRPKRSCHTALNAIKRDFTGTVWFIEGDIQGCFDNINHEILIKVLSTKIKDSKFINIIRLFLKSGYMENWKYNKTYSGCPQGSIIGPILSNIYLNEMDKKFHEIKTKFDIPRPLEDALTPQYRELDNKRKKISYWINQTEGEERTKLIAKLKSTVKEMRKVQAKPRTNKKISFIRYADDWLMGVCGTKIECEEIKKEIEEFLNDELKLNLSREKTLITHSSKKVRFLGYDIRVRRSQEVKGYKMKNGKWRKSRTLNNKVELTVPHKDKIERFLFDKGIVKQGKDGKLVPIYRANLQYQNDVDILKIYNAETRGILNYYNLAVDYHTLDYFSYLMEYSCLSTISHKHNSSTRKIINLYRCNHNWAIPYETKAGTKYLSPVKIKDCRKSFKSDVIVESVIQYMKPTVRDRLNSDVCDMCGKKHQDLLEVHVVRNLNELGNKDWELLMKKLRRKTIVVCPSCHSHIHNSN